jgi:hypothetical protein
MPAHLLVILLPEIYEENHPFPITFVKSDKETSKPKKKGKKKSKNK